MAAFQIYSDIENQRLGATGNPRKSKRGEETLHKQPPGEKLMKRAVLGNISNVFGNRVQSLRPAKSRDKVSTKSSIKDVIQAPYKVQIDPQLTSLEQPSPRLLHALLAFDNGHKLLSERLTSRHSADSPMDLASPSLISESFLEISSNAKVTSHEVNQNQIEDIDLRSDWTLGVPEYAQDIHNYLKKTEVRYRPKATYMKKQQDINSNMRSILVDWLVEVAEEYKLMPQTLFLAINYIDRFLSCMSVVRGKLQLVGTACMLLAAKFEEIYPPEVADFVYITDDTYTSKQVLRMEHLILKTLGFDLSVPTAHDFSQRYLLAAGAAKDSKLEHLTKYLCELALVQLEPFVAYLPSLIAASALCVANYTLGYPTWTPTLEFYSGFSLQDLRDCVIPMHNMLSDVSQWQQQAIQNKYKAARFSCVSTIPPTTCPLL